MASEPQQQQNSPITHLPPTPSGDYLQWLGQLKTRFRQVQLKAAVAVNVELLQFYWQLSTDIAAQQAEERWGSGFLQRLSQDLEQAFPQVKGFSKHNLEQIRRWHRFWSSEPAIAKQVLRNCSPSPGGTTC